MFDFCRVLFYRDLKQTCLSMIVTVAEHLFIQKSSSACEHYCIMRMALYYDVRFYSALYGCSLLIPGRNYVSAHLALLRTLENKHHTLRVFGSNERAYVSY